MNSPYPAYQEEKTEIYAPPAVEAISVIVEPGDIFNVNGRLLSEFISRPSMLGD